MKTSCIGLEKPSTQWPTEMHGVDPLPETQGVDPLPKTQRQGVDPLQEHRGVDPLPEQQGVDPLQERRGSTPCRNSRGSTPCRNVGGWPLAFPAGGRPPAGKLKFTCASSSGGGRLTGIGSRRRWGPEIGRRDGEGGGRKRVAGGRGRRAGAGAAKEEKKKRAGIRGYATFSDGLVPSLSRRKSKHENGDGIYSVAKSRQNIFRRQRRR